VSSARFAASDRAEVRRGNALAGVLERNAEGCVFVYDAGYLAGSGPAVATTLPKRHEPFLTPGASLPPFFANLLPEGVRMEALLRGVKSAKDDLLSALVVVGGDTVGDIAVVHPGEAVRDEAPVVDLDALDSVSFAELFEGSLHYGPAGRYERSALPGVQAKLSARHLTMRLRSRRREAHILKLSSTEYPRIVENEHFFMSAAKRAKLVTATCDVVTDRTGATALLVRRFDRVATPEGVRKIHQEDACQLLNRFPADKYAVSLRDVAQALSNACDAPLLAVSELLRLHAYSYVIGNGDLHGKNVSVHAPDGALRMTPAYDLLSTFPYGDRRMALKLDGRDAKLGRRAFTEFGARFALRAPVVAALLDEVCDAAGTLVPELDTIGFDAKTTRALAREIEARRAGLR
jgi:serine/threonine-protein kinase HipA